MHLLAFMIEHEEALKLRGQLCNIKPYLGLVVQQHAVALCAAANQPQGLVCLCCGRTRRAIDPLLAQMCASLQRLQHFQACSSPSKSGVLVHLCARSIRTEVFYGHAKNAVPEQWRIR